MNRDARQIISGAANAGSSSFGPIFELANRWSRYIYRAIAPLSLTMAVGLSPAALGSELGDAGAYPNKPIRMISPYSPGGNVDVNARYLAKKLSDNLGVPVVVENKPGASSIIGTQALARSTPDGYTIMLVGAGGTTHTVNPSLFKLPYDSLRDFAPVSLFSRVPLVLTVTPSLKVETVRDLIDLAKRKPDALNAAAGGDGTASNLGARLLMEATDIKFTVINYKGNAPALADTMSGQTQMMFDTASTVLPQIKAHRLRALAVTSSSRIPALPDVPTVAESGVPGFEMAVYLGVLAPAGTPRLIVEKLAAEIAKISKDPEARSYFESQAVELVASTPDEFGKFIADDIERWQKIMANLGIEPK